MNEIKFDAESDLDSLNLSSENYEIIYPILKAYSDELNYWKIKHDRLIKKIQDIVC